MKKFLSFLLLSILSAVALADVYVNGYYRKDGTYVQPHYRSSPNSTPWDNFSTKGNVNPYTGKPGTVNPYSSPFPSSSLNSNPYLNQLQPINPIQSNQNNWNIYGR